MKIYIDKNILIKYPEYLLKLNNSIKYERVDTLDTADEIMIAADTSSAFGFIVGQYVSRNVPVVIIGEHDLDLSYLGNKCTTYKDLTAYIATKSVTNDIATNEELTLAKDMLCYLTACLFAYLPKDYFNKSGASFIIAGKKVVDFKSKFGVKVDFSEDDLVVEIYEKKNAGNL